MSGARSELPEGWVRYVDPKSGDPYYHNAALNETTWDHPGRWRVGLFFESLREKGEKVMQKQKKEDYSWSAAQGEDDLALRRRLTERIEALRKEFAKSDDKAKVGELRDELTRRRQRLERLRDALDAEKRKAAELVVAAGGEVVVREDDSDSFGRDEEVRSLRLQIADLEKRVSARTPDEEDDLQALDETMLDVDAAIEDAAVLAEAGVSPSMAQLLRTRPWDDSVLEAAVAEDFALEWQARILKTEDDLLDSDSDENGNVIETSCGGDVGERERRPSSAAAWTCPLDAPGFVFSEDDDLVSVPAALRKKKKNNGALKFPKTKKFLTGKKNESLFTDATASSSFDDLDASASLPGSCWQWLSGWRVEGGGEGWIYGDAHSLALAACGNEPFIAEDSRAARRAPLRCRRWRRTRALVRPPPDPALAPDNNVCVVARKLLELRAHAASLEVLASKLSDQLVSTRSALDASERKAARLPALEAALVETSSMLRDTELRRDALQRQLVATTGVQQRHDSQLFSSDGRTNAFPDRVPQKNNPFVDDLSPPPRAQPPSQQEDPPPREDLKHDAPPDDDVENIRAEPTDEPPPSKKDDDQPPASDEQQPPAPPRDVDKKEDQQRDEDLVEKEEEEEEEEDTVEL
ncbi:hypothetical protein CTAYLR_010777 [Chrysophaeum taylorii]|uniref:WW domain-containing protein n=1 Tax=Chrysophaeum taylorii TaxID=2483200 RepID=A0AAD7U5Z0_9STRA|nr:hypothetical protein CTAYLR_010777 [Chrysophaeum taylorii]